MNESMKLLKCDHCDYEVRVAISASNVICDNCVSTRYPSIARNKIDLIKALRHLDKVVRESYGAGEDWGEIGLALEAIEEVRN